MNINLNELLRETTVKKRRSGNYKKRLNNGFNTLSVNVVSRPLERNNGSYDSVKYSKFIEASKLERLKMEALFKKSGITNYTFTDVDSFLKYDGWFYDLKGRKCLFEVKVRNVKSTDYRNTIIDLQKYNSLRGEVYGTKVRPILFVFFTDGKVLIEDLNLTEQIVTTNLAPITTNGDNRRVGKKFLNILITIDNLYNE